MLLADAVVSLGRQWLFRSGLWKFGVGLLLNAILLIFSLMVPHPRHGSVPIAKRAFDSTNKRLQSDTTVVRLYAGEK